MQFNKNELINNCIDEYAKTFSHTLNTCDFISPKYLKKIDKYIFKNLKKKFDEIEIYDLLYLQEHGLKLNLFQKLKIAFSKLKYLYISEQKEQALLEEQAQRLKQERARKTKRKRKKAQ